jgi:hypothetical protein
MFVRHPQRPTLLAVLAWLWALPWTAVGLGIGLLALLTGGRMQRRAATFEFFGGAASWLLARLPVEPMAMTLGHVILGRTATALNICRQHEMIHVRQYERWGPAFGPAYLLCSFWLWLRGKDAYRDNPFEQQAFREAA